MRCDTCNKDRRDLKDMGRDSNGDPDAPSMCFLCRVQWQQHSKVYNFTTGRYERENWSLDLS